MNNRVELEFDKKITKLAGNEYGKSIFREQVKDTIDYEHELIIAIPERIDLIASSFIQGFFEEIVSNIGIEGIEKKITIESSIDCLKEKIIDNLE